MHQKRLERLLKSMYKILSSRYLSSIQLFCIYEKTIDFDVASKQSVRRLRNKKRD